MSEEIIKVENVSMRFNLAEEKTDTMKEYFLKMIKGEATEDEINTLEEASALRDIAHMPARVKCAVLGWRALREALQR